MRTSIVAPILIMILSIPMIFGLVPPNRLYGFRTPKTLSSDQVWYPANRAAGIALLVAGAGWLGARFVVQQEMLLVTGLGMLGVAVAYMFWYLRSI
jgi:uncharacterized membrane protein